MENIGDLHAASRHEQPPAAADLMSASAAAHARSMGMASILDAGGDYHHHHHQHQHRPPDHHGLAGHLHPAAMSTLAACDRLAGNVTGSFTLMRGDDRGLAASMNNLYAPYHKDVAGMGQSLSPLSGSGLGGIHNSQQGLPSYAHPGAPPPCPRRRC
ncbi:hypothetical protein AAFF_G00087840 [Aldrovandia affinis]|uniref:Uncharacterized protein n=1 Tax=Aldrovandia affinis TaxID=143900 RepID=A0AAD7RWH5_9TELE|nr:hypothetical protein AAFF_G00087840 [Aldrovandia affinis]